LDERSKEGWRAQSTEESQRPDDSADSVAGGPVQSNMSLRELGLVVMAVTPLLANMSHYK